MSSTNRGAERKPNDFYATPTETVWDFLFHFQMEERVKISNLLTLDPCAGGDNGSIMPYPTVLRESFGVQLIHTIDIRPDSGAALIADYLTYKPQTRFDFICSNIPFSLAIPFIQKALSDVKLGGYVAFLSRLSLYGAQKRRAFWQANMPKYTFVHSKRPSFTGGGTDSAEYAHFVWQKGYQPKYSQLFTI